jgi:hypothetical protein
VGASSSSQASIMLCKLSIELFRFPLTLDDHRG